MVILNLTTMGLYFYSNYSSERLNDVNHIERIVRQGESGVESDEEFFDCHEVPEDIRSLTKWNSMELVPEQDESGDSASTTRSSSTGSLWNGFFRNVSEQTRLTKTTPGHDPVSIMTRSTGLKLRCTEILLL